MRKIIFTAILFITFFACANESENEKNQQSTPANSSLTIDGKNLFQANCASCHHPTKPMTGPALKGVLTRVPNKQWIYDFVHNLGGIKRSV
jgi:cytochrome c2